jgi:hypothetical protein
MRRYKKLTIKEYFENIINEPYRHPVSEKETIVEMFALKEALESRRFEIENYWKRATYYWAFVAAIFAGYFILSTKDGGANIEEMKILISGLGLIFSIAWWLNNKGSKYWQKNWEKHVELLEEKFLGKLYKTVLAYDNMRKLHPLDPFPYSVSRINQILSFIVLWIWFIILCYAVTSFLLLHDDLPTIIEQYYRTIFVAAILIIISIFIRTLIKHGSSKLEKRDTISEDLIIEEHQGNKK